MALVPQTPKVMRQVPDRATGARRWAVSATYLCDECGTPSIALGILPSQYRTGEVSEWFEGRLTEPKLRWVPARAVGREFPDVPEHIASAASEAYECYSVGAHRSAGAMARAVVEATAKDKGIVKGNLQGKIDEMEAQHLVRPHIKDAAHEVRHLGNDMAHGDFIDPVSEEEAAEAIELMSEILNEVYQSPAKIERRRVARLAKKQQAGTGP